MADHSPDATDRGYDVEFVETPPKEYECPICLLVLRDPHLTSCCGYLFCAPCISRIKKNKKRCPLCNVEFSTFLDKGRQRKVNELLVRCTEKENGCEWTGELGKLNKHLNVDEQDGECQYVKVPCPNKCYRVVPRCQLQSHLEKHCELRNCVCDKCGLEATYRKIMRDHGANCRMIEVGCPNGCKVVNLRKGLLDEHLLVCPEQSISCKFAHVGCSEVIKRKDLDKHIEESISDHLHHLMMAHSKALDRVKQLEDTNSALKAQQEMSDQKILYLEMQLRSLQSCIEKQLHVEFHQWGGSNSLKKALSAMPCDALQGQRNEEWYQYVVSCAASVDESNGTSSMPLIIKFDQYHQHLKADDAKWFSAPFFTHDAGYKMCLRVMANGNGDGRGSGKGTHISAHFYLMQGEHDSTLVWPYNGKLVIEILNQLEDKHHYRREVVIDDSATMKVRVRVRDRSRAAQGRGKSELIAHTDVLYNSEKNQQYLVDGVLYFRLSVLNHN